jgi:trans-AT polyketide synthase/acyltransferase/oxidoreductase domain-containing protein
MEDVAIQLTRVSSRITNLNQKIEELQLILQQLDKPISIVKTNDQIRITTDLQSADHFLNLTAPVYLPNFLGDEAFKSTYGTKYALYAGSMANGISSEDLVIAMGRTGMMGSFGAGGLLPDRIEKAIQIIKSSLPNGPYIFNLINSPNEPALEEKTAELYIRHGINVIEASAYLGLTTNLVWYRASGLSKDDKGNVLINHRIIAKLSRKEIAKRFLEPAPEELLNRLVQAGNITEEQARLARMVPMADDITVEADSGGHTDNRPLVNVLPAIIKLRDEIQHKHGYSQIVRIGAAGGIATPASSFAAFMMGAAYVVTGSINQSCVEACASEYTRNLLSLAEMTDVAMAPASDMFEMGTKVQVLKRGTMFAMRGQKLFEIYTRYDSINDIPLKEREKLESTVYMQSLDSVWQECLKFFTARDPRQIERAEKDPKAKMALIFRWYLGLSSRWSNNGEKGREMDYQIWCGPAMGAFNDWVKGTYLEYAPNRNVADINLQILTGATYMYRIRILEAQGVKFSQSLTQYIPEKSLIAA